MLFWKKIAIILFVFIFFSPFLVLAKDLHQSLKGRILLQVEDKGQAWYVDPIKEKRAFLGRPRDAFRIMQELGLGISEENYNLFQAHPPQKISGKILLRVESLGEAYYVNPDNLKMYYLGRPADAFRIMQNFGLGIRDADLVTIDIYNDYKEPKQKDYFVDKVVDGDTIDVVANGEIKRIRIIGIDTPEVVDPRRTVECFGSEASRRAKDLLTGQYVQLKKDSTQGEVDKYNRWLRYVLLPNGDDFGKLMISEGLAREYTYKTVYNNQTEYILAEAEAKKNKRGLWADGACDAFDKQQNNKAVIKNFNSPISIVNIFYDGLENSLEGDEYVEIKNNGGVDLNLYHYSLNDASNKIFIFPKIILKAGGSLKVFTGCGINSDVSLYWCHRDSAIWNNKGDKAVLKNSNDVILASYKY